LDEGDGMGTQNAGILICWANATNWNIL